MIFPKVTYDKKELISFRMENLVGKEDFWKEMSEDAIYSSLGIIWLKSPSIKWLLHELLHHLGYSLDLPLCFHRLMHKIL